MLDPGEVGIALRRRAVFPAGVALQLAVPPFLDVEGWVGHHEVGAEVRVLIAGESVRRFLAEVEVDAAGDHVHRRRVYREGAKVAKGRRGRMRRGRCDAVFQSATVTDRRYRFGRELAGVLRGFPAGGCRDPEEVFPDVVVVAFFELGADGFFVGGGRTDRNVCVTAEGGGGHGEEGEVPSEQ